jgi:hypothetical protein
VSGASRTLAVRIAVTRARLAMTQADIKLAELRADLMRWRIRELRRRLG